MQIERKRLSLDSKRYSAEQFAPRSDGLHVSHIIYHIEQTLGFTGKKRDPLPEDTLEAYRAMGFVAEHLIQTVLQEQEHLGADDILRPGELGWCSACDATFTAQRDTHDDTSAALEHFRETGHRMLYLTPDGINVPEMALEEWKATWMSRNRGVAEPLGGMEVGSDWTPDNSLADGVWKWPVQVMAYCWVLGLSKANMRVFFVNGNWKDFRPEAWSFRMEFTQKELDKNFNMLVRTARSEKWL